LEKLYPVVAVSTIGEVPDDMDLMFPSIRVLTEQEKAELAKATVDSVTVCINSGIFSPRTGGKEIKQSSSTTGFGTNLTDDAIEKLSDDIQAEGELGEGLFGEEGGKTLDPSSSPTGVLKETDKLKAGKPTPKGAGEPGGASEEHEEASEGEAEDAFDEDGLLRDPDDVAPVSLSKRRVMDVDLRQGVTLCQQCRARLNGDDNAEVNGKVVCPNCAAAYHRAKAKDADGPQAGPKRSIHGLSLVIETPAGYERHGRDKKNVPWRQTMAHDYGYIVGHAGADGDSLDCYLGPDSSADWCYVVDQSVLGDRRRFDESKVLLGFASQGDALRAYKANHHRAKDVYLDFTPMHVNDFKAWLASRNPRRPCSPEALK